MTRSDASRGTRSVASGGGEGNPRGRSCPGTDVPAMHDDGHDRAWPSDSLGETTHPEGRAPSRPGAGARRERRVG
ncbi:MAG: hypothetical protein KatS3mg076_1550 [Candidatus Binatia bacterium]|nr:MAG: hypothetical protein KatS3mg076_1550 [Candidatus Binatia bacterium]